MAWNKKITLIGYIFSITFLLGACKVQQTGFGGLYIGSSEDSTTHSTSEKLSPLRKQIIPSKIENNLEVNIDEEERELVLQPDQGINYSLFQHKEQVDKLNELLNSLTLLRNQVDSIQWLLMENGSISMPLSQEQLNRMNSSASEKNATERKQVTNNSFRSNEGGSVRPKDATLSNEELVRRLYDTLPNPDKVIYLSDSTVLNYLYALEQSGKVDADLITFYYEVDQIIPVTDFLDSLDKILQNQNVILVEIKGFDSSSGDQGVDSKLTDYRISYLYQRVNSYVLSQKIIISKNNNAVSSDNSPLEKGMVEIKISFEKD